MDGSNILEHLRKLIVTHGWERSEIASLYIPGDDSVRIIVREFSHGLARVSEWHGGLDDFPLELVHTEQWAAAGEPDTDVVVSETGDKISITLRRVKEDRDQWLTVTEDGGCQVCDRYLGEFLDCDLRGANVLLLEFERDVQGRYFYDSESERFRYHHGGPIHEEYCPGLLVEYFAEYFDGANFSVTEWVLGDDE